MDERDAARRSGGHSDRRKFLKRLGATIAAGVGLAVVPATNAYAPNYQCCPTNEASCGTCPPGYTPHHCSNGCCTCLQSTGNCQVFSFLPC
ncbi:MAG TPA: twin-arginine translocation signal domain-containing protein [Actinomycetota bacterium]|nr:twin-arginine translocation signal domain-containing protein [Actinomycetota bacterium]